MDHVFCPDESERRLPGVNLNRKQFSSSKRIHFKQLRNKDTSYEDFRLT